MQKASLRLFRRLSLFEWDRRTAGCGSACSCCVPTGNAGLNADPGLMQAVAESLHNSANVKSLISVSAQDWSSDCMGSGRDDVTVSLYCSHKYSCLSFCQSEYISVATILFYAVVCNPHHCQKCLGWLYGNHCIQYTTTISRLDSTFVLYT